jgi:hypothetical protein
LAADLGIYGIEVGMMRVGRGIVYDQEIKKIVCDQEY